MSVAEGDEVIVLHPAFCASCQQPVDGDAPQPQRHHVCDLPPMCPVVTESPWHRVSCPGGGEATHAAWPVGVPSGMGGPRAHAMASRCPGASRLSQRTTQRLLDDLFGLQVRVGTISQLEAAHVAPGFAPRRRQALPQERRSNALRALGRVARVATDRGDPCTGHGVGDAVSRQAPGLQLRALPGAPSPRQQVWGEHHEASAWPFALADLENHALRVHSTPLELTECGDP